MPRPIVAVRHLDSREWREDQMGARDSSFLALHPRSLQEFSGFAGTLEPVADPHITNASGRAANDTVRFPDAGSTLAHLRHWAYSDLSGFRSVNQPIQPDL